MPPRPNCPPRLASLPALLLAGALLASLLLAQSLRAATPDYVRVNQVGYLTADTKIAVAFSNSSLAGLSFSILRASDNAVMAGPTAFPASSGAYDPFANTYKLDFSAFQPAGTATYKVHLSDGVESPVFKISPCTYAGTQETVLNFYLAQRCGTDNKYAGAACHLAPASAASRMDGKVVGGPNNNALIDAEGAWHDSGDFIKFMITVGWSCETLLLGYRENPAAFADNLLANGKPGSNGLPDVLDEAKYALDWIMKMNPDANTLYYQVGGQEDHNLGLGTLPQNDNSAYATAPYRPVYFGNGSNTCGKAATCLAMAYQIWNARGDTAYAATCLAHATQIYALGKSVARMQAANPASFYSENDWRDDMEWAAAEMYRATGNAAYLADAKAWAAAIQDAGGELDWNACNFLAHYSLYPLADAATQASLKTYMANDLAANLTTANSNPYGLSTTYSWGSMEVLTGAILKAQLYKKLFNVTTYDAMATSSRDFLFGKNPWGVSFIVGLGSTYAHHPQHNIAAGLGIDIPGMPIEGPDAVSDWATQGITLGGPDIYAPFQASGANGGVYHDDVQDYATNECTTTHAGLAVAVLAALSSACSVPGSPTASPTASRTRSATASATPWPTVSASPTVTTTRTPTATPSATPTLTATPSSTPTRSWSPTLTLSPVASATASGTGTTSPTRSASPTGTVTPSATATATRSATVSQSPSPLPGSPTASPSASLTSTLSSTPVVVPSASLTATLSSTPAVVPSASLTSTLSSTPVVLPSASLTSTLSSTPVVVPSASLTSTPSSTPAVVPSASLTSTLSSTPAVVPSASLTATLSSTPVVLPSASLTASPSPSSTPTIGIVATLSPTPSQSLSASPTTSRSTTTTMTPSPTAIPATMAPTPTMTPAASQGAGDGEVLRIRDCVALPAPNARELAVQLEGRADALELRLYTADLALLAISNSGPDGPGWLRVALPPAWKEAPNGTYFYVLRARRGVAQAPAHKGVLVLVR